MPADPELRRETEKMAAGGFVLGLVAFLFPSRAARVFGFPAEHDNATARTIGRLYAIREAARGVQLTYEARSERGPQPFTIGMNLAIDAADAAMLAAAIRRRAGITRAAGSIFVFAATTCVFWLRLYRRVAAAQRG